MYRPKPEDFDNFYDYSDAMAQYRKINKAAEESRLQEEDRRNDDG